MRSLLTANSSMTNTDTDQSEANPSYHVTLRDGAAAQYNDADGRMSQVAADQLITLTNEVSHFIE